MYDILNLLVKHINIVVNYQESQHNMVIYCLTKFFYMYKNVTSYEASNDHNN